MTAFERYGMKNVRANMWLTLSERLNRAQWRDVIERCGVQRSTLAV